MGDLLTRNRFPASVDRVKVAADWRARGYSCSLFTDPPGRQWLDFVHGCNELVTVVEGRLDMRIGDRQWEIVTTTNGVIQTRASGKYSNSSVPKIAPG